jgi:hypothetical protein
VAKRAASRGKLTLIEAIFPDQAVVREKWI